MMSDYLGYQTSFNRIWLVDETCKRWRANHCRGRSLRTWKATTSSLQQHYEWVVCPQLTLIRTLWPEKTLQKCTREPLAKFGLDAVETATS
jgi:hypothetical protein